ncbi:hypothetical protein J6590_051468 [Homalodisca vitripennis]|nr:hypothetical protein J6590_051468 [Homalodisca vitripennis]
MAGASKGGLRLVRVASVFVRSTLCSYCLVTHDHVFAHIFNFLCRRFELANADGTNTSLAGSEEVGVGDEGEALWLKVGKRRLMPFCCTESSTLLTYGYYSGGLPLKIISKGVSLSKKKRH